MIFRINRLGSRSSQRRRLSKPIGRSPVALGVSLVGLRLLSIATRSRRLPAPTLGHYSNGLVVHVDKDLGRFDCNVHKASFMAETTLTLQVRFVVLGFVWAQKKGSTRVRIATMEGACGLLSRQQSEFLGSGSATFAN